MERVTVRNFVRAETDRMFAALATAGVNRWQHQRSPARIDRQTVIRMNRDTLYSHVLVDLAAGASLELPDAEGRYQSAMVVNQDHLVDAVLHDPGRHRLGLEQFATRYVLVLVRTLADPADEADMAAAHALQDRLGLEAGSAEPFVLPDYDTESFDAVRAAVLGLARFWDGSGAFGAADEVDPVAHLLGTAAGWGGLPESEAVYLPVQPDLPVTGRYRLTLSDVPVDGFWSVSVYNRAGYFEPNERGAYSVNDLTAVPDGDGRVSVHFGNDGDRPNLLPITEGWNYLLRLYRPHPEARDRSWSAPRVEALD